MRQSKSKQEILMCPPTYYAIEYKINPWMVTQVNGKTAEKQWQKLRDTFVNLNMKVSLIEPVKHLPDMVFTADQGAIYDHIFIKSNFRFHERQRESIYTLTYFKKKNFAIVELPKGAYFEGQGDFLIREDTILFGVGHRSNLKAAKIIKTLLNKKVIFLHLVDPYFFHLDTALCVLPNGGIMYYKGAFSKNSLAKIENLTSDLIGISKPDAYKMACNAVVYRNNIVVNKGLSKGLIKIFKDRGLSVFEVELSEFLKSGGGAHCLTWNGVAQ